MKAAWDEPFALPAPLAQENKKKVAVRSIWHRINEFFDLETTDDKIWFFGFYGISFSILFFIMLISNVMDLLYK
ncbi:DUF3961 domain-containing protein [Ectobacillus panaciterrae]|uniref:DUF3961 domain-containing protein n=1 Tax=Ectobacillus panaciterrae TaxID=363872 RepID=UPI0004013147|nr:DUF3961 domain-containing protein [Ectobacillus panaciterrae]